MYSDDINYDKSDKSNNKFYNIVLKLFIDSDSMNKIFIIIYTFKNELN